MSTPAARDFYRTFLETIRRHDASTRLRTASMAGQLADWTASLTSVVVTTCGTLGLQAAAKGHPGSVLPVSREEYLSLDVCAFRPAPAGSIWPSLAAVFELENNRDETRVSYSLWKVLQVGGVLRVVFAYKDEPSESAGLISSMTSAVITSIPSDRRAVLGGETAIIVGSKAESSTFPDGFFKAWTLEPNIGKFTKI